MAHLRVKNALLKRLHEETHHTKDVFFILVEQYVLTNRFEWQLGLHTKLLCDLNKIKNNTVHFFYLIYSLKNVFLPCA